MNLHNFVFILAVTTLLPCSILGRPSVEVKGQEIANTDAKVYDEKIIDDYDYEHVGNNNLVETDDEGNQDEGADKDDNEQIEGEDHGEHEVIEENSAKEQEEKKEGKVGEEGTDEENEEKNEQQGFQGNMGSEDNEEYSNGREYSQDNDNQNGQGSSNSVIKGITVLVNKGKQFLEKANDLGKTIVEATIAVNNAGKESISFIPQPVQEHSEYGNAGLNKNKNASLGRPTRKPNLNAIGNNHRMQRPPNTGGNRTKRPIQKPSTPHGNRNNQRTQRPLVSSRNGNMRPIQRPSNPKAYGKPSTRRPKGQTSKYQNKRYTKKSRKYKG